MAYDEKLAQRVRSLIVKHKGMSEKKMFGGIAFLLFGKMCCGVLKDDLVVRIGFEDYERALNKPHVRPMDFTGQPMKGYVYVGPEAIRTARSLQAWLDKSIGFVTSLPETKKTEKQRAQAGDRGING